MYQCYYQQNQLKNLNNNLEQTTHCVFVTASKGQQGT